MDAFDDPFMSFVQLARDEGAAYNPVPFLIGDVACADPLLIQVGELQLEREDVFINAMLLPGFSMDVALMPTQATGQTEASEGGSGEAAYASHSHTINSIGFESGSIKKLDALKKHDKVVLLVNQEQTKFVVLCKVR